MGYRGVWGSHIQSFYYVPIMAMDFFTLFFRHHSKYSSLVYILYFIVYSPILSLRELSLIFRRKVVKYHLNAFLSSEIIDKMYNLLMFVCRER